MIKELELYLHIPFCVRKCRYCDFLSAPCTEKERSAYVDALCNELKCLAEGAKEYEVTSVFLGGGTPTVLSSEQLKKIFETINSYYNISNKAEVSVECNPGTITAEKLQTLKEAGVNRLSLGLQSTLAEELQTLGRIHSFEEFKSNYELARKMGFANINIDLMQSLPGQTREKAVKSLETVLALKPEHLSVYSLIIEEGTPFYEEYSGKSELLPDEKTERDIYHETDKLLTAAGFKHYEISNYALPGYECRHNCGYWTGKEYLGFGIGAASLFQNKRYSNTRDINEYISAAGLCVDAESICELTKEDRMSEYMFLGLRMLEGVSSEEFEKKFGISMQDVYGSVIEKHLELGTLEKDGNRIKLSKYGLDVCNSVMCEFV